MEIEFAVEIIDEYVVVLNANPLLFFINDKMWNFMYVYFLYNIYYWDK